MKLLLLLSLTIAVNYACVTKKSVVLKPLTTIKQTMLLPKTQAVIVINLLEK